MVYQGKSTANTLCICEHFNKDRAKIHHSKSVFKLVSSGYNGAKEMLMVDKVDNKEFLAVLFSAIYEEVIK